MDENLHRHQFTFWLTVKYLHLYFTLQIRNQATAQILHKPPLRQCTDVTDAAAPKLLFDCITLHHCIKHNGLFWSEPLNGQMFSSPSSPVPGSSGHKTLHFQKQYTCKFDFFFPTHLLQGICIKAEAKREHSADSRMLTENYIRLRIT